ncbi:sigma-70 family RNA polymerase sigma factor [Aromatoleum toluclasticum]|uniref:sigma-70 family RNA polymerase sigma factor n=1 Tax=Aromatoleum toluclasticum TaxID=92003 RepID=UPI001D17FDE6|nr:sigma-70 family RNA polymerase sigma factor [Aromatoleum toluclasticum]MCC4117319.1 sigma-70 family RNA polymerase sigma factor [Aromatoleum toluclasticum]
MDQRATTSWQRAPPAGGRPPCSAEDAVLRTFFCAAVEALTDRLYGTALRFTRNPAAAEDLVAETVAKAWMHLPQLEDRVCFEKWIFRILANTFFSQCRHAREDPVDPCDGDDAGFSIFDRLHQPFLLWWGNPEQELIHKLLCEDIDRALAALPDCYRAVVIPVDLLGYSYAEVAEMLAVPVGTVRSRLNRARAQLQRALWNQALAAGLVHGAPAKEDAHD